MIRDFFIWMYEYKGVPAETFLICFSALILYALLAWSSRNEIKTFFKSIFAHVVLEYKAQRYAKKKARKKSKRVYEKALKDFKKNYSSRL